MLTLIGTKNIGEEMDKIIAKLAAENSMRGVIDNAHFNDPDKLGRGQEMVDKLSELLCISVIKCPTSPATAPMATTLSVMLTNI